jgi:hypothetical protein
MKLLFQKQNYNVLSPSSYTRISVRDLFISRIGLPILHYFTRNLFTKTISVLQNVKTTFHFLNITTNIQLLLFVDKDDHHNFYPVLLLEYLLPALPLSGTWNKKLQQYIIQHYTIIISLIRHIILATFFSPVCISQWELLHIHGVLMAFFLHSLDFTFFLLLL